MASWLVVLLFSMGAVALFILGLSITIIFKGHYMDSEISTNKDMQRLGIRCAVHESRMDEQDVDCETVGCTGNCAGCDIEHA